MTFTWKHFVFIAASALNAGCAVWGNADTKHQMYANIVIAMCSPIAGYFGLVSGSVNAGAVERAAAKLPGQSG